VFKHVFSKPFQKLLGTKKQLTGHTLYNKISKLAEQKGRVVRNDKTKSRFLANFADMGFHQLGITEDPEKFGRRDSP